MILSSSALRAQLTADTLAKKLKYKERIHYMKELYFSRPETIMNIISLQDNSCNRIFVIGHNPGLTEFGNMLLKEHFTKLPTMGVIAIQLDIENWEDIEEKSGEVDFFIYPKQFKYYMPKQIRTTWDQREM